MKLIKNLACLMLVSAATLSAATFVNTAGEEADFDNKDPTAIQPLLGNNLVELSMTSTIDYPLTATEAAALSLASLFLIIIDDATIDALRSVLGVLSQDGVAGVDALRAIDFAYENETTIERANLVKQSIAALFTSEGGALRDATTTTPWGVSSAEIVVQAKGDADTTTILSLDYLQKSIIELAREENTISTLEGYSLNTLTLLTYSVFDAFSILVHIGAEKLRLFTSLGQEVQRQQTANILRSIISSSSVDDAVYHPVGLISRDRLISVNSTTTNDATTKKEHNEDL